MKRAISSVIIALLALITLGAFISSDDKTTPGRSYWSYDGFRHRADTSIWSNRNGRQIDFHTLDSAHRLRKSYIGLVFNKWPLTAGDYRIAHANMHDSDIMILAADELTSYHSMITNSGMVHVTLDHGKLHAWASGIRMEVYPKDRIKWTGVMDSTLFSFDLSEQ